MTKKELEALIDNHWQSALRRQEERLEELERRISWAEGKLAEPEQNP